MGEEGANETMQILWAFSIWLESVAILPQLFMLQRTGEAETITTHYLFALGAYRALYIPNWVYRYMFDSPAFYDPIAVIAGIIQTILYSDFFYIYYTKSVLLPLPETTTCTDNIQGHPRQEVQPPRLGCARMEAAPFLLSGGQTRPHFGFV
jgi:hypothetical protein